MHYTICSSISFDAGHAGVSPDCILPHGHSYTITVELRPKFDQDAAYESFERLDGHLISLRMELRNRSLNDMIDPSRPTLVGLASFIWQRLSLLEPDMLSVKVDEGSSRSVILGPG
jgi:6-pyruvoyl-tetrahydropterin synthase